ncbi:MAG: hypothetical protein JW748_08010 [Anaerolineales bacterium]|nr:hypothetical protein [Anaerolineales bacterium]
MNRKIILLGAGLLCTLACVGTATTVSENAVNTEVARQLTSMAALTQAGGTPLGPVENGGGSPGELPTVTPTGSPPPSATPTVTATTTQTPTVTPPAGDPRLALGTPNYRTDFPDGTNWYLYDDSNVRFDVVDHKFLMVAKNANAYDSWTLTSWKLTDYYLEMTATTDTCSGRDRYGLVVGVPHPANNPSYLARFSCDGYYSFGFFDSSLDNKFHYLADWTPNTHILAGTGQTNRMGFKADGTHLILYANGHYLTDFSVPSFGEGRFGLFVGAVNTANFTVRVSEVAYWILP